MQITWREGQRGYYIINGRVYNSFIRSMTDDGLCWLQDGRVRNVGEIFKSRQMAYNWLRDGDAK